MAQEKTVCPLCDGVATAGGKGGSLSFSPAAKELARVPRARPRVPPPTTSAPVRGRPRSRCGSSPSDCRSRDWLDSTIRTSQPAVRASAERVVGRTIAVRVAQLPDGAGLSADLHHSAGTQVKRSAQYLRERHARQDRPRSAQLGAGLAVRVRGTDGASVSEAPTLMWPVQVEIGSVGRPASSGRDACSSISSRQVNFSLGRSTAAPARRSD